MRFKIKICISSISFKTGHFNNTSPHSWRKLGDFPCWAAPPFIRAHALWFALCPATPDCPPDTETEGQLSVISICLHGWFFLFWHILLTYLPDLLSSWGWDPNSNLCFSSHLLESIFFSTVFPITHCSAAENVKCLSELDRILNHQYLVMDIAWWLTSIELQENLARSFPLSLDLVIGYMF